MSALTELYAQISACQRCEIAKRRTKAVPGEGPENAEIMFIGEAPGWHEDQQGRPFVGPAGQYLDQLLASIGMKRTEVYITNVIKTRPPENREPLPHEIANCRPYLERQIELIRPKIIVTLGRYSMAMFFPGKSVSKIHGTARKEGGMIYFAMYHPAAALHQGNLRQEIEKDIRKLPGLLVEAKATPASSQPPQSQAQQLNLF